MHEQEEEARLHYAMMEERSIVASLMEAGLPLSEECPVLRCFISGLMKEAKMVYLDTIDDEFSDLLSGLTPGTIETQFIRGSVILEHALTRALPDALEVLIGEDAVATDLRRYVHIRSHTTIRNASSRLGEFYTRMSRNSRGIEERPWDHIFFAVHSANKALAAKCTWCCIPGGYAMRLGSLLRTHAEMVDDLLTMYRKLKEALMWKASDIAPIKNLYTTGALSVKAALLESKKPQA